MRTIFTRTMILTFVCLSFLASANNIIPSTDITFTLDGNHVHYKIGQLDYDKIFSEIELLEELDQMKFVTKERIEFIQVINVHNEIEFQLPVASKKLVLDLQDFDDGSYALNFLVKGKEHMVRSQFTKK